MSHTGLAQYVQLSLWPMFIRNPLTTIAQSVTI